jgi:hypothetical protein
VPFRPSVIPPPKRWAGPTSRGFWGSTLPGIPGGQTGFNSPTAGCSLGLYPPRACRRESGPSIGPGSSLTLLRGRPQGSVSPGVSEFRSTLAWPDPPSRQAEKPDRAALSGFPHRYEPAHASVLLPGLWVHLAPRRTLLPTAGAPEAVRRSTGVVRASPEVPNIRAVTVRSPTGMHGLNLASRTAERSLLRSPQALLTPEAHRSGARQPAVLVEAGVSGQPFARPRWRPVSRPYRRGQCSQPTPSTSLPSFPQTRSVPSSPPHAAYAA